MAIMEMPPEFSGVPASRHDLFTKRELEAQHGSEIAEITEIEEAIAVAEGAVEAARTEVRTDVLWDRAGRFATGCSNVYRPRFPRRKAERTASSATDQVLLLALHHLTREANDDIVLIGLSVKRDAAECGAFDLHSPEFLVSALFHLYFLSLLLSLDGFRQGHREKPVLEGCFNLVRIDAVRDVERTLERAIVAR
jgi:hypothetical protein